MRLALEALKLFGTVLVFALVMPPLLLSLCVLRAWYWVMAWRRLK